MPPNDTAIERRWISEFLAHSRSVLDEVGARRLDNHLEATDLPLPVELGTFSPEIARVCGPLHRYLRATGEPAFGALAQDDLTAVRIYSRNSQPFHAITRGWALAEQYDDLDAHTVLRYFPNRSAGRMMVDNLSHALKQLPTSAEGYDVGYWAQGYQGNMAFRGAWAQDDGRVAYHPDSATESQAEPDLTVRTGDFVTNPDFMSSSAHPGAAAQFVMRQPVKAKFVPHEGQDERPVNDSTLLDLNRNNARVFFRIDHTTGRNITPVTAQTQAEILFNRYTVFRVESVLDDLFGLRVHLTEVDRATVPDGSVVKNVLIGGRVVLDAPPREFEE